MALNRTEQGCSYCCARVTPFDTPTCATIAPDPSTPTWSFFHPRFPLPSCFAAAHSPSPTIESPVLSTMRCLASPDGTRGELHIEVLASS